MDKQVEMNHLYFLFFFFIFFFGKEVVAWCKFEENKAVRDNFIHDK